MSVTRFSPRFHQALSLDSVWWVHEYNWKICKMTFSLAPCWIRMIHNCYLLSRLAQCKVRGWYEKKRMTLNEPWFAVSNVSDLMLYFNTYPSKRGQCMHNICRKCCYILIPDTRLGLCIYACRSYFTIFEVKYLYQYWCSEKKN